ncbi:acyloxyacyl hydrolase [Occallatibacter riparius]|uniref:Acyloxyacyl hydrolase n=1 Tax=Occallatibacter riparius TaxID=1002689 RepID=A0A9J7BQ72_9BACT|nr:acyloxyacyl hydrolase [Occallatibacter riparius]UWZ84848.1 acyloxyacyl hydrolase [Occallatibacter riparius]
MKFPVQRQLLPSHDASAPVSALASLRPSRFQGRRMLGVMLLGLLALSRCGLAQSATPDHADPAVAAVPAPAPLETPADLPDAPDAPLSTLDRALSATSPSESFSSSLDFIPADPAHAMAFIHKGAGPTVPLNQCPTDETRARECRIHWHQLIIEASIYNAFQDMGNLYTGYWYRWETTHGKWWDRYVDSVQRWRWDHWGDDNPVLDDYVGHSMMGSITNYMWIQNDPKGMTVEQANDWIYWRSRLRALAFSTAFSFWWKMGPTGEAGIGHNGDHYFPDKGVITNETGWVELVTTPLGGLGWTIGEDALDKHLFRKIAAKPHRPVTLLLASFLTPSRATANIFRFRPPWYRDAYQVKANTFWSDPAGPEQANQPVGDDPPVSGTDIASAADASAPGSSAISPRRQPGEKPEWPRIGGVHEFGAWWGLSLMTGHVWGYAPDVKYMPIDVNYSYLLNPNSHRWAFRYAPEVTALAMLDEKAFTPKDRYTQRQRSYGAGVSPVGFRTNFFPDARVQPYVSGVGGFIYFNQRVLSPQGSQFMYTIDFGTGLQFFRKKRQAWSLGYRYQHLSNANISHHNPGTDANTFYVAVSRFRIKGYR